MKLQTALKDGTLKLDGYKLAFMDGVLVEPKDAYKTKGGAIALAKARNDGIPKQNVVQVQFDGGSEEEEHLEDDEENIAKINYTWSQIEDMERKLNFLKEEKHKSVKNCLLMQM